MQVSILVICLDPVEFLALHVIELDGYLFYIGFITDPVLNDIICYSRIDL